ncbi:MAG: alpha/beta hydrolase [Prochlorotrichaceae cyanobacterium]|jgi:dienelactone hydrolase
MSFTNKLLAVMGAFPNADTWEAALHVPTVRVTEQQVRGNILTEHLEIVTPDGDDLPALLQYPTHLTAPAPGILCLHQTTRDPAIGKREPAGLEGDPAFAYGYELAQRGFVTLMPDYPKFGAYQVTESEIYESFGYESITLKAVVNHMTALSYLSNLDQVDRHNLGCIGHSLGGSNTLFLACLDQRIKVIAVSCGFSTFAAYAENHPQQNLQGWSRSDKYMPLIHTQFQDDPALMPFDFPELMSYLAPLPIFINAPKYDDVFPFQGVEHTLLHLGKLYKVLGQSDRFEAHSPEVGHGFPEEIRDRAYHFIKTHLSVTESFSPGSKRSLYLGG